MSDFNCYNYFYVADLPSFIEMPEASIEAASCNSPSLYARTFFLEPRCEMVNTNVLLNTWSSYSPSGCGVP